MGSCRLLFGPAASSQTALNIPPDLCVQFPMIARRIYAAVAVGVLLRFIVGLHPVAWLVWFAPFPLLMLAFTSPASQARWLTSLAAIIGLSVNFHYFRLVMPLPMVVVVLIAETLLWTFVIMATRRIVLRYQAWWTVFAYPVLWAAVDTLAAHVLPDGNWGSLAYSQADYLPILQVTSLFGVAGLLFLVALIPSTLALAFTFGTKIPHLWRAYAVAGILFILALGYGELRLKAPITGTQTTFGLVAIDDPVGPHATPAYIANIWQSYDQHIATLASQGATVIVLPEKIGLISPTEAAAWQQHLSHLAARFNVWIEAGVGIDDGAKRINLAWLFTPQGTLSANYQKHHMAPPEREYIAGHAYDVRTIDGSPYGLAICKDMHFAAMGQAYGERRVSAMLVPAWDFYLDGWIASRTTLTRGVENGFTIIRSSREGLLTVSDPYGRVLAERQSQSLPGATLLARVNLTAPIATLYTRIGDLFGWLCVIAAAAMMLAARLGQKSRSIAPETTRSEVPV
jgi:apolipoprotein N-acyltransferase